MNLQQLVAAAITETARPDMGFVEDGGTGEIPQKISAAALTMHTIDYFPRDIKSLTYNFDQEAYIQEMFLDSLLRYRKLAVVKKISSDYNLNPQYPYSEYQQQQQAGIPNLPPIPILYRPVFGTVPLGEKELHIIQPDYLFDDYGRHKHDVAYQAGATIFIKSSTPLLRVNVSYYAFPNVTDVSKAGTDGGWQSWIGDNYPWAVIYQCVSHVFTALGKQDTSRKYDSPANPNVPMDPGGLVQQQITRLIKDQLLAAF